VPIEVAMPKLSDTMEEGKIIKWMKQVGEAVKPGDVLAEVETDKANMELEAYDEGVLSEVRVGEGESAPVGGVIAVLAAPGEPAVAQKPAADAGEKQAPAAAQAPAGAKPTAAAPAQPKARPEAPRESWRPAVVRRAEPAEGARAGDGESVRASPVAKRMAREQDIDLGTVTGTGPGGRIVERDVEAAVAARGTPPAAAEAPASKSSVALRTEARSLPTEPAAGRVELSRIRRTTAKRMGEAKREVPHFYASAEIAVDEAVRLKEALAELEAEYEGLTYTHLVLKAVGLALRRVPELNASYDGDAMVLHDQVNIGLATATDEGLVVPVVRNCDREPLAGIVRQVRALVERAKRGRFAADDLSGGTFTVSNLGMFPVSRFAAVINPPQAAILAVGTIRDVPVVREREVVPGHEMSVTLSCDHRIIDGVLAGRFLRELKTLLERPLALVV
jgi:pyruvate dehydrogenase E2 component (dihydrolipoamide acetyltransferase)